MTGHSTDSLPHVLWSDAELETVTIDYDDLVLTLTESTGKSRRIRCQGYIGYVCCGFWDEMIVEGASLSCKDPFLDDCLGALERRLGSERLESGNEGRNKGSFETLRVRFIDGATLVVVAARFTEEDPT